jgi:hypothetical protein
LGQDDLIPETPPLESQSASASGPRALPPGPVSEDDIRQLQARLLQAQIAEVEARTAAIVATPAPPASTNPGKNDLPIVRNAISFHPGIDSSLIRKIYDNEFQPTMLPKLRVGRGAIYFQDESLKVGHDGQITKGEKVGSIKDFGADPYIWNESFDNYISICSILYFPQFPQMAPAMLNFRKKIVELSRIYAWSCVLQAALEHHSCIVDAGVTDYTVWEIPQPTILRLCPFNKQLSYISSATAQSTTQSSAQSTKKRRATDEVDHEETCRNFNSTWGCKFGAKCYRKHICSKCDSSDHGEAGHKK